MFAGLADLVARYGYAMVVLIVGVEGLGIPVPGEGALVIAAAIASRGRLSLVGVIAAGAAGTVLGGTGGYWLGRLGGTALLRPGPALERGRRFFDRHGATSVFLGRFVALLRTLIGMLAGLSGMPFGRFSAYNALGGLLWAAVVACASFFFGRSLPRLRGLGRAGLAGALFISLLVALGIGWLWFRSRRTRLADRAAKAGPAYLALHLAVGLLCGLATVIGFGAVTETAFSHEALTPFDVTLTAWWDAHTPLVFDRLATVLAAIAGPAALALLAVGVLVLLLGRGRRVEAAIWTAAVTAAALLDVVVGLVVRRPPAPNADTLSLAAVGLGGGDAVGVVVVYGLLAYLATGRLSPVARATARGVSAAAVAGAALSRLVVGAQYFSGLLTGCAAGVVWLSACVSALELVDSPKGHASPPPA
ncbi:MAG TPA: DedA family protein [Gemmatimonadales bacterium]|nr:DedA family protein [Gemmatimonadales bacterium]